MDTTTQRAKVLNMLQTGQWVSILSFLDAGVTRFGGRIFELRKQGFEIESREERVGRSRRVEYRLVPKRGQQDLFV